MHLSSQSGQQIEEIPHDIDLVTMGINAQKPLLHEAHYITMSLFAKLIAQRSKLRGLLYVDDREFGWDRTRKSHFTKTASRGTNERVHALVTSFMENIGAQLGIDNLASRLEVLFMSEHMQVEEGASPIGLQLYRMILENGALINECFNGYYQSKQSETNAIKPYCSSCLMSTVKHRKVDFGETSMSSNCLYPHCDTDNYTVDVARNATNWRIHYAIDPIRDYRTAQAGNVGIVHMFGGDYALPWGEGRLSKADRLANLAQGYDPSMTMHYYTGPYITNEGRKVSTSDGDTSDPLDLETIERLLHQGAVIDLTT